MIFKVLATIAAILYVPKLAYPQVNLLGISLRVATRLCTSAEPDLKLGSEADSWNSQECAFALKRDGFKDQGQSGIWRLACQAGSTGGGRVKACKDMCDGVPHPSSTVKWPPQPDLREGCRINEVMEGMHCRTYYKCQKRADGTAVWEEVQCKDGLYYNAVHGKCESFNSLRKEDKQDYCQRGCVARCPNGKEDAEFPRQKLQPWHGGPARTCDDGKQCIPDHKKNVTSYCRAYQVCEPQRNGNTDWKEYVCETGQYWYQSEVCSGQCRYFHDLPEDLQYYYSEIHKCCPVYKDCYCELCGWCKTYYAYLEGRKHGPFYCSQDLWWLPNNTTGGTCAYFENLPPHIQKNYTTDRNCSHCDWIQTADQVCSPNYIFIDENLKHHPMTCPKSSGSGKPLFFQIKKKTCDECWRCVDFRGNTCPC